MDKAEDFTRQQDYIRQCAHLLSIEETGLNNLVNKFIRERVTKQESKWQVDTPDSDNEMPPPLEYDAASDEGFQLLIKDELQERAVVKALIEFGGKEWDEGTRVADYIFSELNDNELFDNPQLQDVINTYRLWFDAGLEPTARNFFYHENQVLSAVVVSLLEFPYEVSEKWRNKFQMAVSSREESYKEEVLATLGYLKLRKIKRMILENQADLGKDHTPDEQINLLQTHQALKQMERELLQQYGTVIMR